MKAVVAEIDKKQMIVITDKGDFIKVKRQLSVGIGDEIELKTQKVNLAYRRLASIAACFLACIFLSTGVYAYYTPYSYVSVDINPSIALSLNRFERVITVNPLNEDAVSLLKDTKGLKNQDLDEALSSIIKSASQKGYIDKQTENQVMVVVSAKNPEQEAELAEMVTATATSELAKVNNNYGVMVEKASVESYKEALSNKVSPGKEILADRLREVIPEIKDEEVRDMSVRDVVHMINEGRKAVKAAEKDKDKEDKEEPSLAGTERDEQEVKEAAKDDSKADKDNKGSGKSKPAAAADKANSPASDKVNESENGKDNKSKAVEADKGNGNKDSNKGEEDNKDESSIENGGKHNDGSDRQADGNGGKGSDNDGKSDKDKGGQGGSSDKEKNDGKKGN